MDEQKVEALAERILGEVNSSMNVLNIYLGHKLGLYKTMKETGPVTTFWTTARTASMNGSSVTTWVRPQYLTRTFFTMEASTVESLVQILGGLRWAHVLCVITGTGDPARAAIQAIMASMAPRTVAR